MSSKGNFICRPNCAICGNDKKTVLFSKPFTTPVVWEFLEKYYGGNIDKDDLNKGVYEIAKCTGCGFIWQVYILNDEFMEKLYRDWISPDDSLNKKRHADIALYSGYAREMNVLACLLSKKPYEVDVLDYGMGWGYWCLMAKAFGYNVSGFEINRDKMDFARSNGISVLENVRDIRLGKWDFINTMQVFEHLPDPKEILEILTGSLKKGGIIRISVPNKKNIERKLTQKGWKPSKNAVHPLEHINCYSHRLLIDFADTAGLRLVKQPFMLGYRYSIKSYITGVLGRYYRYYFDTSLYFRLP